MSSGERPLPDIDPENWSAVGGYLRQATVEMVHRMGGQINDSGDLELPEGADEIRSRAQESEFSEEKYTAVAEEFISRAEQIQQARLYRENRSILSRLLRRS